MLLYVESDNAPAVAVYSRLGFEHADARHPRAVPPRARRSAQRADVEPDLGIHDDVLGGGISSTVRVASTGTLRLTSARAIGPSSWWRALEPTKPMSRPSWDTGEPGGRKAVLRAVEVQQHQAARRPTEGVDPRDGLLAAVAALVEVHRRADPADLVGDRAVVGVEAEAGLAALDPQRLEGPEPGGGPGSVGVRLEAVAGHQVVAAGSRRPDATSRQVVDERDLDAGHELHPLQPLDQRRTRARLGVGGEGLAVVDAGEGVLDVALRAEHERLGPGAGGEAVEVLGGQVVQPGQPVGAGDPEDVAVGQVDEALAGARLRCSVLNEP